jgi:hypothetical protein
MLKQPTTAKNGQVVAFGWYNCFLVHAMFGAACRLCNVNVMFAMFYIFSFDETYIMTSIRREMDVGGL